jgi:hypothetical protein
MGLLIMIKVNNDMWKINITNLVMLIVTMVKFIMAKPIMAQLIMVKLIMLN